ncbi:MAG TPA: phosphoglucosamine mutase [Solirubrobacterales bacterium]|jgi:phosphoglucosamine mutase|nr:phosphoglucosamine mutase [Solirubrobacterales bacterium]
MTTGRKLFGTDGVRGEAGTFLTAELATALGRAATASLDAQRPQVLIVRDTRESGPMLESALAAGIAAAGGDALLGGVLPTPAAAILVKRLGLDLAAVVSASHNPYRDNGIKFFSARGTKLDDAAEARIEALIDASTGAAEPGSVSELNGGLEDYLRALESAFPIDLSGHRVVLDCANGATFRAAPTIFERLGATVETIATEPDGRNINDGCGSTHLDSLAAAMVASEATVGFAFDGDGDRVLAVDGSGRTHDGDELIALAARGMAARGELAGGVAVTVMSNYGFHQAMEEAGIEVAVTGVGDRYVLDELRERSWALGGEQSGHIIDTRFVATGDGTAAALATMRELAGRDLSAVAPMEKLPQVLVNVEVADREAIAGAEAVWEAVEREGEALEGRGRVLLRPSGTEPLVRVMVEAPSAEEADAICERLVTLVRQELT